MEATLALPPVECQARKRPGQSIGRTHNARQWRLPGGAAFGRPPPPRIRPRAAAGKMERQEGGWLVKGAEPIGPVGGGCGGGQIGAAPPPPVFASVRRREKT